MRVEGLAILPTPQASGKCRECLGNLNVYNFLWNYTPKRPPVYELITVCEIGANVVA